MHYSRVETMAMTGHASDLEAFYARMGALLKEQPGLFYYRLANSLGEPSKYGWFLAWESREAARALQLSDGWRAFHEANPTAGIATNRSPLTAYEQIFAVGTPPGDGPARDYSVVVQFAAQPPQAELFEERIRGISEIRTHETPGRVMSLLYRHLGDPSRYLLAIFRPSLEELRASARNPAIRAYTTEHPLAPLLAGPPTVDTNVTVLQYRR